MFKNQSTLLKLTSLLFSSTSLTSINEGKEQIIKYLIDELSFKFKK